MKKMVLAMAAAVMMSTVAMAQDKKEGKEPRKLDKTEMVKHRTEHMVKQYGLNATQQKQLQALNEKYADKMGPSPRGRHHHGPRPDSIRGKRPEPPQDSQQPQKAGPRPPKRMKLDKDKMGETMKAYDEELQKILTADQYTAYKADMKKRFGEGHRHHRGPRPDKKQE